jgi:hypothetical protein
MLWSLGATALTGVAAIFTQGHEVLWRLLGTGATTTVAAALMWPLTRTAEKPTTRLAGLVGMSAVLIEFFLLLVLIWEGLFLQKFGQDFEILGWAALFLPMTASPAVVFLLFFNHPAGWLASRVGAGAAAVTFVELMIGSWNSQSGFIRTPRGDWGEAASVTALFGILGVACLAGTLRQRPWRWAGVLASSYCWLIASIHALQGGDSEIGRSVFTVIATLAAVVAYLNLFSMPSLAPQHEIFRLITFIIAVGTALLIDTLMVLSIHAPYPGVEFLDLLGRLAAAAGIVTACGTVAIMILALINMRHMTPEPYLALSWVDMEIVCPACERRQKVALGESACCECQLPFSIRIGERPPREKWHSPMAATDHAE